MSHFGRSEMKILFPSVSFFSEHNPIFHFVHLSLMCMESKKKINLQRCQKYMGCSVICTTRNSVLLYSRTRTHGNVNSRLNLSTLLYNCLFQIMKILICFLEGRKGTLTVIYHRDHGHHSHHHLFWLLFYCRDKHILTKSNLRRWSSLNEAQIFQHLVLIWWCYLKMVRR